MGFKIKQRSTKKHDSFHATDSKSNKSNTWFTPRRIIDGLNCTFDLDPCTESFRPFDVATTSIEFDKGDDGLKLDWNGAFAFVNPPYGRETPKWLKKMLVGK